MSENIVTMDSLPFNLTQEESDYFVREILPQNISAIGHQWGFDDTVFRDEVMEFVVKEILKYSSVEEYYESDVAKNYFDNDVILSNELLFGKTKKFKIFFDVVFFDKEGKELENRGNLGITAVDMDKARKNAFFAAVTNFFREGYVLKSLNVTKIEE
jgi:hypothetical protein